MWKDFCIILTQNFKTSLLLTTTYFNDYKGLALLLGSKTVRLIFLKIPKFIFENIFLSKVVFDALTFLNLAKRHFLYRKICFPGNICHA